MITTPTPPPETITIPFTAWEQAVFVALFVAFTLGVLAVLLNNTSKVQKFLLDWSRAWQDYLMDLRRQDIQAQEIKEKSFNERNSKVVEALDNVTTRLVEMGQQFAEHDAKMTQALTDMRAARAKTKPRTE